jgi:4-oxalocrotonate tautomerase
MPVISLTIKSIPEEQKKQLIQKLTAEAVNITKISPEHFTVLIQELPLENLGVSGKTVKDIYAGK